MFIANIVIKVVFPDGENDREMVEFACDELKEHVNNTLLSPNSPSVLEDEKDISFEYEIIRAD